MEIASEALQFAKAARSRDQLQALESMQARQKVVMDGPIDRDILAIARNDDEACCSVLEVREGRLLGKKHHFLGGIIDSTDSDVISAFARQFYLQNDFVPNEIHLPILPSDAEEISVWLSERMNSKVTLFAPQRGAKAQMMIMAEKNAQQMLKERQMKREMQRDRVPQSVYALQRDLNLQVLPRRIEGIDISNFQGTDSVGSLVCFVDGQAKRSQYRFFKIRDIEGPNDFASIHQVVLRRFTGLKERGESLPDLLLIDGGKGQLSSAVQALREVGTETQPVLGIAKRLEEVFLPGHSTPIILPKTSASLRLLQMLRDEAHRFALKNHRDQRGKRTLTSSLDNIPGVGPKRRNALLKLFGSVQRIRAASTQDIADIPGFSLHLAKDIKRHLGNEGRKNSTPDHG